MKNQSVSAIRGLALLSFATSCAHSGDRLKATLDPYVGKHPDQLVEKWGAPDSTYAMESGVKVLTYTSDRTVSRYSGLGYTALRFGTYSYTDSCKIHFYTDQAQKKLERYTTAGDSWTCVESLRDLEQSK